MKRFIKIFLLIFISIFTLSSCDMDSGVEDSYDTSEDFQKAIDEHKFMYFDGYDINFSNGILIITDSYEYDEMTLSLRINFAYKAANFGSYVVSVVPKDKEKYEGKNDISFGVSFKSHNQYESLYEIVSKMGSGKIINKETGDAIDINPYLNEANYMIRDAINNMLKFCKEEKVLSPFI